MQALLIAIPSLIAKAGNVTDDNGDRYALELGALLVAPNFLVAVGYTSVADQTSYDAFNIV